MTDYPAVTPANIATNARLFADRYDMVRNLASLLPTAPMVCELGVAYGDFSQFLLDTLSPKELYGLDIFWLHQHEMIWGKPSREVFKGLTHEQFYRERFADKPVKVMSGDGVASLAQVPNQHFDFIYVDAGHHYDEVQRDTKAVLPKVKPGGILQFNDYIMLDHVANDPYGIVQVVNQLVASSDWKVIGFALQHQMFCDIALQRVAEVPYSCSRMKAAQP